MKAPILLDYYRNFKSYYTVNFKGSEIQVVILVSFNMTPFEGARKRNFGDWKE
jgi:hypothetical protein